MKSKILGKVDFKEKQLQEDINKILQFKFDNQYSDYYSTNWTISVLWNKTGLADDFKLENYEGEAKYTEFGVQLEYINTLIKETFNSEYIKWVRIFRLEHGIIMPHIDYSKLDKDFIRVHIPLQTDIKCLGSNEETVFHMRKGEVWFLDAGNVHSGANFSDSIRVTLCIDFSPNIEFDKIFRDDKKENSHIQPLLIDRPAIDNAYIESLKLLGELLREENFNDIVTLLAKEHFFRDISASAGYDYLIDVAKYSKDKKLIDKALSLKKYYLKTSN